MWGSKTISIADHDSIVNQYRKELESLRDRIKSENIKQLNSSDCEVDFEKINAVSIERFEKYNQVYTIIGYKDFNINSSKILGWNLYCSYQEHQKLAAEFREYKDKKTNSIVGFTSKSTGGILSPSPLLSK